MPRPTLIAVSDTTSSGSVVIALRSFWRQGRLVERVGYVVGSLLLASGLIHVAIIVITGGRWEGPVSLRKAATFGLSFGLTLISIVWVTTFLRLRERWRVTLLATLAVACVLETTLVSLQAWRGVPSHFNVETTFDGAIARSLAGGGIVLVAIIGALLTAAFRAQPGAPVSLRVAIRFGFLSLFSSLIVGAVMIARGMRLVFSGDAQAAYTTGGMLKPTHAVTMHAILILPVLAWLLSFTDWPERRRVAVVWLGIAGYSLLAGVVVFENIIG